MPLQTDLHTWENLRLAYHNASRGKRGQPSVAAFELYLADHLLELERELAAQTYRPGPYHSFYIHEPKRRLISAAPFRDRVVHHALCNLTVPAFEKRMIAASFANRPAPYGSSAGAGRGRDASRDAKFCVSTTRGPNPR